MSLGWWRLRAVVYAAVAIGAAFGTRNVADRVFDRSRCRGLIGGARYETREVIDKVRISGFGRGRSAHYDLVLAPAGGAPEQRVSVRKEAWRKMPIGSLVTVYVQEDGGRSADASLGDPWFGDGFLIGMDALIAVVFFGVSLGSLIGLAVALLGVRATTFLQRGGETK